MAPHEVGPATALPLPRTHMLHTLERGPGFPQPAGVPVWPKGSWSF